MLTIVPVVEGIGDEVALPLLLRRILAEVHGRYDVSFTAIRSNGRQTLERELGKFLQHAVSIPGCQGILIMLDADNDCPVEVADNLRAKVAESGVPLPVQIVYAHRTYESWFLASLDTVKGARGISATASLDVNPEGISNPKEWLREQMPQNRPYKELTDQAALSNRIDIGLARTNSRSFQRLCHALEQLLDAMEPAPSN